MSQRIRIRCKDHEPHRLELEGGGVIKSQRLPDWTDVEVALVRDDGTEEPIHAVNAIDWRIRPGETSTAVLEVVGPALEVDAELGARAPSRSAGGLDAVCSDHRNAWARFASVALASSLEEKLPELATQRLRGLARSARGGDVAAEAELELELRTIRETQVKAAAEIADLLTRGVEAAVRRMSPHPLVDVWKKEDQTMAEINAVTIGSLIGARVLVTTAGYGSTNGPVEELELLEVSPAGTYVRVRNTHGVRRWMRVVDVRLLERLVPLEPDPARVARKDVAERVEALEKGLRDAFDLIANLAETVKRGAGGGA